MQTVELTVEGELWLRRLDVVQDHPGKPVATQSVGRDARLVIRDGTIRSQDHVDL